MISESNYNIDRKSNICWTTPYSEVVDKLQCHSGTQFEEVIGFINKHKGRKMRFHYEERGYPSWGNDDILRILDEPGDWAGFMAWFLDYAGNSQQEYENKGGWVHNITIYK